MNNIKIVNLTPHPIKFADGTEIPSEGVARCEQTDREVGSINGIPVVETTFGAITGLPESILRCDMCGTTGYQSYLGWCLCCRNGCMYHSTVYVVSAIVAQEARPRSDVFFPARLVRDEQGRIIGCGALGTIR